MITKDLKKGTSAEFLNRLTEETLKVYRDSVNPIIKIPDDVSEFSIFKKDDVVLFQGDSITDCDRDRNNSQPNNSDALGTGYPDLISTQLLQQGSSLNLQLLNRAVGGDRVFDLVHRWKEDALQLHPNVLSILIGVNDYWYSISEKNPEALAAYEQDYRKLLKRTLQMLPDVTLIIGEPFASKGGTATTKETGWDWDFEAFRHFREAALRIARDFKAILIPYQSIFDKALQIKPVSYWSLDGVHPSPEGHKLMAIAWMKAIELIDQ